LKSIVCVYFYVFCVFAFTAIVDLEIGMTLAGWIGSVDFYLQKGEPYLKSSYGSFINWWDGTFHWSLYIYLTYLLTKHSGTLSDRVRVPGMIWVGSIMNSLVVFLPGNVAGKFGWELQWSYLLNVPYALFPMLFVLRLFSQSKPEQKDKKKTQDEFRIVRILDFFLFFGLIASIFLAFLRLFAALNSPALPAQMWLTHVEPYLSDPTLYPLLQTIIYVVYFVPFYLYAAHYVFYGGSPSQSVLDWTSIYLGASLQAQFSYVGPALHNIPTYPEPTWRPVPPEGWDYFVVTHAFLTIFPLILWLRVFLEPKIPSTSKPKRS